MTLLIDDYVRRADGAIRDKHLALEIDVANEASAVGGMTVPREALELIVRNLIDNAVQHTPSRGSISIMNGNGENKLEPGPILVVENGPVKLTEKDLPRLFEPFWQFDRSRSDRSHVGLGLTVVKRIAEATGLMVIAEIEGDRLRMSICRGH